MEKRDETTWHQWAQGVLDGAAMDQCNLSGVKTD